MSLTATFNKKHKVDKQNDFILGVSYGQQYNDYDFLTKVLTVHTTHSGVTAIPFAQLDAESLDLYRAKLTELGGKPPAAGAKVDIADNYEVKKVNDDVLRVIGGGNIYYYDFVARMATAVGWGGMPPSSTVVQFSQIDRQALEAFREKLIALEGNPPALPKVASTASVKLAP